MRTRIQFQATVKLNRYAIRAGQNLPDKEFRYLRTVIVTAAVHRGLVSVLCPKTDTST